MEREITKIISIGANCFGADFAKALGIREKGPVDNIACFNIWNSPCLFTKGFKKKIFHTCSEIRKATHQEITQYHFYKKVYSFKSGFLIVHNNYNSLKYKISMLKRIRTFGEYYNDSKNDNSLWYLYTLERGDESLSENQLLQIKNKLPRNCSDRLIILGIRVKNKSFEKIFHYYFDELDEEEYEWESAIQAERIKNTFEDKYGLKFIIK